MEFLNDETFDGIQKELENLNKKIIVKSEGNDVLTIQLLGQVKQIFRDMSREILDAVKKYEDKT